CSEFLWRIASVPEPTLPRPITPTLTSFIISFNHSHRGRDIIATWLVLHGDRAFAMLCWRWGPQLWPRVCSVPNRPILCRTVFPRIPGAAVSPNPHACQTANYNATKY